MCGVAVETEDFHKFAVLIKRFKWKVPGFRGLEVYGLAGATLHQQFSLARAAIMTAITYKVTPVFGSCRSHHRNFTTSKHFFSNQHVKTSEP